MQNGSTIEAARACLEAPLHAKEVEWEATANRVVSTAATRGMINAPDTRQQVGAMILQEMRRRAGLCADAVMEAVDQMAEDDGDDPDRGELEAIAVELLEESSRQLIRMRDALAAWGDASDLPTTEQCFQAGREVIAERLGEAHS